MKIQYIEKEGKKEFAIVPIDDFKQLIEAAEYTEDIRDIKATADDETFPEEFVKKLIGSSSPLLVWREYRGLTQAELAKASGVSQGFITQIELGKKTGSIKTLVVLARTLDCDIDALIKSEI